jgi:sulfite reductase alpha subunit-like flavoprotein
MYIKNLTISFANTFDEFGPVGDVNAENFLTQLKGEKRYQRNVY